MTRGADFASPKCYPLHLLPDTLNSRVATGGEQNPPATERGYWHGLSPARVVSDDFGRGVQIRITGILRDLSSTHDVHSYHCCARDDKKGPLPLFGLTRPVSPRFVLLRSQTLGWGDGRCKPELCLGTYWIARYTMEATVVGLWLTLDAWFTGPLYPAGQHGVLDFLATAPGETVASLSTNQLACTDSHGKSSNRSARYF